MIVSVSKVTPSNPLASSSSAVAARPGADDTIKSVSASPQAESAVVKISVTGAQRSQPITSVKDQQGTASDEAVALAENFASADQTAVSPSTRQGMAAKLYKDADANHDGMVSVLEAGTYNFINPSLPSPERLDELAGNRTAVPELQAYASVASAE